LEVADAHEAADAGAQPMPDRGEDLLGPIVALASETDQPVGVGSRAERLTRGLGRCDAGAVRLEVAAARAIALARLAVLVDDDVPELGPAPVEATVDHDPAAHAR